MLDEDGYPTERALTRIRLWPATDMRGLLEFVRELWSLTHWTEEDGKLSMTTGGWSGNESLIRAMQENFMFWGMCWESSHRGGLHVFDLTRIPKED